MPTHIKEVNVLKCNIIVEFANGSIHLKKNDFKRIYNVVRNILSF